MSGSRFPALQEDGIGNFAGDLPEHEQRLVWAAQGVPDTGLFDQKLDGRVLLYSLGDWHEQAQ